MTSHSRRDGARQDAVAGHNIFPTVVDGGVASSSTGTTILLIPPKPDITAQDIVESSTNSNPRFCVKVCCQVEIHFLPGDSETSIVLYSRDSIGNRKSTGGDEFYIRYEERIIEKKIGGGGNGDGQNGHNDKSSVNPSKLLLQAVALITDRHDGSYLLDFCTTPMNSNLPSEQDVVATAAKTEGSVQQTLTVYFEYTNGIGSLPPPTKDEWENGGYTHTVYHHHFLAPLCDSVVDGNLYHGHHVLAERPRIRTFHLPTMTMSSTLESFHCGDNVIDLGQFDQVFAFGDSTFCQLVRQRPNKNGKYYFRPNLCVGEKVRVGLNSSTTDILLSQLDDELGRYLSSCGPHIVDEDDIVTTAVTDPITKTKKKKKVIALIVGSCLWDILDVESTGQGSDYADHAQACQHYITSIRQRYPTVQVIWKLPMAVHIHWVDLQRVVDHDRATATLFGINRIKYMSQSRSKFLYMLQKQVMIDLNVPFLDLYEATYLSVDWLYPSDGRHYRPDLNRLMLNWFYRSCGGDGINGSIDNATSTVHSKGGNQKYFQQVV